LLKEIKNIVIIGSGNVAFHLINAFRQNNLEIIQVLGRNKQRTKLLAERFPVPYIIDPALLNKTADLYILAVQDDLITETAHSLRLKDQLLVHASGFGSLDLLKGASTRTGVFWPLQTVTFGKEIDYRKVPVFIEGSDPETANRIKQVAEQISEKVAATNTKTRQQVHLAAVIASNLTNHMYSIASSILEKAGVPFDMLAPLILETATKAALRNPASGQTGPAVRKDLNVIRKHLEMLENEPEIKEIYRLVSENIIHLHYKENEKL
jgi:predicted short-subunit dehydrogenase-like oxidoreductase (DUF2520 family)